MLSEQETDSYKRNGYLVRKGFYSAAQLETVKTAFMEAVKSGPVEAISEASDELHDYDPLKTYPRMLQPHRYPETPIGGLALDFMLEPRFEPILRELMADEPIGSQTMFYFKPPGARGQALHQDNASLQVRPGTCMAAWLAVDESDPENGGMMVVPGSHTLELLCPEAADTEQFFTNAQIPIPEGMEAVHVVMELGDVLFFNGSLIHGSTPNTSQTRFRRSLIAHYVPASCREVASYYEPLMSFDKARVDKVFTAWGQLSAKCGDLVASPE